jgi:hypothetical protein
VLAQVERPEFGEAPVVAGHFTPAN